VPDVFGRRLVPSNNHISAELNDLRAQIKALRTRLWSLNIPSRCTPPSGSGVGLPTVQEVIEIEKSFMSINNEASSLPNSTGDSIIDSELVSFRKELDASRALLGRLKNLGEVSDGITKCDDAFSDLLEHADTYPAPPPSAQLASSHVSDPRLPCEEQLKSRLAFCKDVMDDLGRLCKPVNDDQRIAVEQVRIQQTWQELALMCTDRLNGTRSRPPSSVSSAGGRGTISVVTLSTQRKPKPSLGGSGPRPAVKEKTPRRSMSGINEPLRPPSNMSMRSVSGPNPNSSLYNPTFASRQRTTSLASIQLTGNNTFKRPMSPLAVPRSATKRVVSPTFSDASNKSLASTPSRSTWARAPRQSFGTVPKNFQANPAPKRKPYVANPTSKLDVAVGNVVNNFRLPVTVQVASTSWQDQSGKYWIGDVEPKLCFCRILRSQMVMVRVGGGWCELSK